MTDAVKSDRKTSSATRQAVSRAKAKITRKPAAKKESKPAEPVAQIAQGSNASSVDSDAVQSLMEQVMKLTEFNKELLADPRSLLAKEGLHGPDPVLMNAQAKVWNALMDYYFRLEFNGFEKLPKEPSLLIGIHSGVSLTMDAWTVIMAWWRHFGGKRTLHGTAHDLLMDSPGVGHYFRRLGAFSPTRENITKAFEKGDDVILWPGGEVDSCRSWSKRDKAILGGRKGFIRLAIRQGVPITPVATVGGHDTLFVLSEGRGLAKMLKLKERLRTEVAPITLSFPFGLGVMLTPFQHIPLPAKIRTELLDPIYVSNDPEMANDEEYVQKIYDQVEGAIQDAMDRLADKRKFPIFG